MPEGPEYNGWVFTTCSDFDLGKDIEKVVSFLRFHRTYRCQLIYFATCLANCHNGDVDKFFAAHPTWAFGKNKKPRSHCAHVQPKNVPPYGRPRPLPKKQILINVLVQYITVFF